jgi:hypothetical protein
VEKHNSVERQLQLFCAVTVQKILNERNNSFKLSFWKNAVTHRKKHEKAGHVEKYSIAVRSMSTFDGPI